MHQHVKMSSKHAFQKYEISTKAVCGQCSAKTAVDKNFARFKGKHLCRSVPFNKFACCRIVTLLKRGSGRCFFVYFAKSLKIPFYRKPVTSKIKQSPTNLNERKSTNKLFTFTLKRKLRESKQESRSIEKLVIIMS